MATLDSWGVPREVCSVCDLPLDQHWRGRACLQVDRVGIVSAGYHSYIGTATCPGSEEEKKIIDKKSRLNNA